jgi:murein DD-endopeptidase MepM/ murein hydrolase activator NlpD
MSLDSSARDEQQFGVELNPAGESKIFWVFDTPESEWSVRGGPGSFVSGFQYGHCGDDYYALDLARKDHHQYGKPVYAGIDGIVYVKDIKDESGNYIAWGKEVIIYNSESKIALRYAHLSDYDASLNGKWVSATSDTPIGKVGDTGLGTGAHLHIVLYKNVNSIEEGRPVSVSSCSVKNGACVKSATEHAAKFSFIPRSNAETTADLSKDPNSPTVQAFAVLPDAIYSGDSFTVYYSVSDNGGSGLKQVELWRKDESTDWQEIKTDTLANENDPFSGSFTDSPSAPGKYRYGLHVVDNAGNWNDEMNSNSNSQPSFYGAIEVDVIEAQSEQEESVPVTLTLYVHEGSVYGPFISDATIEGQDGSGNSFQQTTDNGGYVIIEGDPGTWSFSVSAEGYETNNWDQDITEDGIKGAFLQQEQDQDITLTLYIHDGSASGPIIPGARVTGWDGLSNNFDQTSSSSGYVTITGYPGTWSFSASADGYETNSWSQEITETDTKDAFLQEEQQYSQNSVIGKWDLQYESECVDTEFGFLWLSHGHSIFEFHKDGTFSSYNTEHETLDENGIWVESQKLEEPRVEDGEWTQYEDTIRLQYYPEPERIIEFDRGEGYCQVWQSEGTTGELIINGDSMSGTKTSITHYCDHWSYEVESSDYRDEYELERPVYRDESISTSYTGRRIDTSVIPDTP